jgi:hypothetical protein
MIEDRDPHAFWSAQTFGIRRDLLQLEAGEDLVQDRPAATGPDYFGFQLISATNHRSVRGTHESKLAVLYQLRAPLLDFEQPAPR